MQNTTDVLYSRNDDEFCGLQDEIQIKSKQFTGNQGRCDTGARTSSCISETYYEENPYLQSKEVTKDIFADLKPPEAQVDQKQEKETDHTYGKTGK